MKALVDVAVFGLMAVPAPRSSSGDRRTTNAEMTASQRVSFDITERMRRTSLRASTTSSGVKTPN
jgi:hypothetical protein